MTAPALELADIFRLHGDDYRSAQQLPVEQHRAMRAIEQCRTAALGGRLEECSHCDHRRFVYHSCRNRHCPKCQSLARAQWLASRKEELLPVEYFHVVFTLPEPIAAIALQNKAVVYNILFQAAAETLTTIAGDPQHLGARIGFFAILHTWGQTLMHHPHLHCVVPGGGLSADETRWISCRPGFFLSVRVLSRLFRRLFLHKLEKAHRKGRLPFFSTLQQLRDPSRFRRYLATTRRTEWVVYSKPPFGGPATVLEYLGRYTHRVAISNPRLLSLQQDHIRFRYKDYRHPQRPKSMTLQASEFIRRFLLHVLPPRFQRIRYYGLAGNRYRRQHLLRCRQLLAVPPSLPAPAQPLSFCERYLALTGRDLGACPICGVGRMVTVELLLRMVPNRRSLPRPDS
jgi:hypothetical protein